ncbi:MAG: hypothetical protein KKC68_07105 [Candidatus Thermoplasmatota archaeon]|nr:hypothetical protein [Candidatus Thermoplasmatota archaeon]MBU1941528.1 hypothetical protein [Candidatus Thermoplasmatota archaeon]
MKSTHRQKILLLFISMLLLLSLFTPQGIAETQSNSQRLNILYTITQPELTELTIQDTIYDSIQTDELTIVGNPGDPALPAKLAYILLPSNTRIDQITVTSKDKILLDTNLYINPVGEPIPIDQQAPIPTPQPNPAIYSNDAPFPGTLYTMVGTYIFRGYRILALQLHPLEYNPVSKILWYYPELTVHITTTTLSTSAQTYRGYVQDRQTLLTKVDNPEIVATYDTLPNLPTNKDSYDLMILTTDAFVAEFTPLKDAHDAIGQPTIIKTLTDVGSTTLDDIRDFIRDAYTDYGIEYLLIGGDDDKVPAPTLWVYGLDEGTDPYETYLPSDIFYACLDGPYNYDGDAKWGEPTDGTNGADVDLYAEVYVGRACVGSTAEVANFVTKTIAYLNKDPEDPYLSEMCLAGEYLGDYGIASYGGNYCDQLIDSCSDDGYTTVGIPSTDYTLTLLYDRDYPGHNWPKSDIMSIINNDVHVINHLGHASYGYNLKMYDTDVYSLTNDKYCFIYSQGCMAGGFDSGDCIAEYFTVKSTHGAFAVIMNARYGWFWSYSTDGDSQRFHRQFWDAVFNEQISQIGKANHDSKEDNLGIIDRSCIRWVYYETNLFGDPLLDFFEVDTNNPPETPAAPTEKPGEPHIYIASTTDPEENPLEYMWDWGDGTYSNWIGPYPSGTSIETEHFFMKPGTYEIRVKARDDSLIESAWSPPLIKTVETPIVQITSIKGGFRTIQAQVHNTIDIPLTNISWLIRFRGGIILNGLITNGNIQELPPQGNMTIETKPVFGLGLSQLTIRLAQAEQTYQTIIIGPFILLKST